MKCRVMKKGRETSLACPRLKYPQYLEIGQPKTKSPELHVDLQSEWQQAKYFRCNSGVLAEMGSKA